MGQNIISKLDLENIQTVGPPLEKFSEFGFAVRKGDAELLAILNEGLSLVLVDGTLERLTEKWIIPSAEEQIENVRYIVFISLSTMFAAGFIITLWTRALRGQVRLRTAELDQAIVLKDEELQRRVYSEQKLEQSEAMYRSMIETLPQAIYVSSGIDQLCEYLNPAFVRLFGYNIDDVPSVAEWWPLAYPDESYRQEVVEQWQSEVQRAIETQTTTKAIEAVVHCKDGSDKIISWEFITLGEKNYAVGTDLTVYRQAERELSIAATAFNSQQGMLVTDSNAKILKVNDAFTSITGYSSEEVVGQNPRILNAGRHDKTFYIRMWDQIKIAGRWEGEIWNRHKNGEIYPEFLTISAVKDSA